MMLSGCYLVISRMQSMDFPIIVQKWTSLSSLVTDFGRGVQEFICIIIVPSDMAKQRDSLLSFCCLARNGNRFTSRRDGAHSRYSGARRLAKNDRGALISVARSVSLCSARKDLCRGSADDRGGCRAAVRALVRSSLTCERWRRSG
jgi:hypothetical protein